MNAPRSVVGFIANSRLIAAILVLSMSSCGGLPDLALVKVSVVDWRDQLRAGPRPVLLVEVAQNDTLNGGREVSVPEAGFCGVPSGPTLGGGRGFRVRRSAVDRPPAANFSRGDFGPNLFTIIELSKSGFSTERFTFPPYDLRNDSHDICLSAVGAGGFWGARSSNTVRIPRSAITAALARGPETPPELMLWADVGRTMR
jgi:hypothetical protein